VDYFPPAVVAMNCALCQANSGENVAFFVAIAKTCRNNLWAIAIPITLGGLPAAVAADRAFYMQDCTFWPSRYTDKAAAEHVPGPF